MYDVIVIGCGITGAAAAFELSRYDLSVLVLERENDVSNGTSKANSGILHAGYDPEPGTLMARLNVEGARLAKKLCRDLDVPYRQCGSLVLAFSDADRAMLNRLLQRGRENGVPDLEIWARETVREREPALSPEVTAALYAPTAAVVSPWEYTLALAETAVRNGVKLELERPVTAIRPVEGGYEVTAGGDVFAGRFVLNAAGVHADAVHNMAAPPSFRIIPDRGEYYLLDKTEGEAVGCVIFQCPTKIGKGTLVAPTAHGNLIVGPNNELTADGDNTATTRQGLLEVETMARKSMPGVNLRANIRNFSGVRAAADVDDFIIGEAEGAPGFFDLAGIKSPGLTAAPAIAKLAVSMLREKGLVLREKAHFTGTRRKVHFAELSVEEKQKLVKKKNAYGRVICRCETITEGEILDALNSPIPPRSVEGVKRRCNAGMGRCQGGFCGPRVVEILARELGISPMKIPLDKAGSAILVAETKGGRDHE